MPITQRSVDLVCQVKYGSLQFAKIESVGQRDERGWAEVLIRFDAEEVACEYALSFGPKLEVLEPVRLRDRVIEISRQLVEFYEQKA